MTEIVPRWEWRTFGTRFPGADETAIERLATGEVHESEERYLLAPSSGNVKIRDDLMDVKVLRETDARGLERWEPVLKAPFPLGPDQVAVVIGALGLASVEPPDGDYDLDRLLAEIATPNGVRNVILRKLRRRSTVNGCMAELSDVEFEGRATLTIAVESEDPSAVIEAVRVLGLADHLNTSYVAATTALLAGTGERYAVIDVGTNSVKFHVGEWTGSGWRTVADRAEVTRLGEGLQASGSIADEPLRRTIEAIGGMVAEAKREMVRALAAVGTAGLRMAANRDEVVTSILERTGVGVEVIPGEEEARLAYLAVTAALDVGEGSTVVFDTGGGSSQFTFGRGRDVEERFSVDVGAARYTERFGLDRAVERDVVDEALRAIGDDLARLDGRPRPDALVGMGGAITNLTAVALELEPYDPERIQGAALERAEVERQIERYRTTEADARRSIVGLQPNRAEVILAGACIVRTVMTLLDRDRLTVSDRGLRHGLLAERFSP